MSKATYVLDTFAAIAYLQEEPGEPRVSELFDLAANGSVRLAMTVVNLAEVFYMTRRRAGPTRADLAVRRLREHALEIVDADQALSLRAGLLKSQYPVSLADCYAAALAIQRDGIVVTGDLEFGTLEHEVRIEWLPR